MQEMNEVDVKATEIDLLIWANFALLKISCKTLSVFAGLMSNERK